MASKIVLSIILNFVFIVGCTAVSDQHLLHVIKNSFLEKVEKKSVSLEKYDSFDVFVQSNIRFDIHLHTYNSSDLDIT